MSTTNNTENNTNEVMKFSDMKVSQLKDQLRYVKQQYVEQGHKDEAKEIKLSGKKADLVARVEHYMEATEGCLIDESLLNKSKRSSSKKKVDPSLVFQGQIRDADFDLTQGLKMFLEVYGLQDLEAEIEEVIVEADHKMSMKPKPMPVPETREELSSLTVKQLKSILDKQGKKKSGKKADLIDRVLEEAPEPEDEPEIPDQGLKAPSTPLTFTPPDVSAIPVPTSVNTEPKGKEDEAEDVYDAETEESEEETEEIEESEEVIEQPESHMIPLAQFIGLPSSPLAAITLPPLPTAGAVKTATAIGVPDL